MSERNTVTALLPAYNSSQFIQGTLESLSAQKHPGFRVIISVDLCEDETHSICEAYCRGDPRFRIIRQNERLGYAANCNALMDAAESDYVFFAFHDDILLPGFVEKLSSLLDAQPEAIIAFPDILVTHVNQKTDYCSFSTLNGIHDRVRRGAMMIRRPVNWWVPNRGIFRLRQARKINGIKTHDEGVFSSDWPWLFHMSLLGVFLSVPEVLCHKFFKPQSLTESWEFSNRQQCAVTAACLRELWNSELRTDEKLDLAIPLMRMLRRLRGRMKLRGVLNNLKGQHAQSR